MAIKNENDESDLLILSDDDMNSDSLIVVPNTDNFIDSSESELITFDDDLNVDLLTNSNSEVKNSASINTDSLFDINNSSKDTLTTVDDFDFSNLDSDNKKETTTIPVESSIDNSNSFDFSVSDNLENLSNDLTLEKPSDEEKIEENLLIAENNITTNSSVGTFSTVATIGTMAEILDKAITDMSSRTEVIELDIKSEETEIKKLKDNISELESHVVISEKKVLDLNKEKTMIAKNIKSLEKMKLIETSTDTQK